MTRKILLKMVMGVPGVFSVTNNLRVEKGSGDTHTAD